MPEQPTTAAGGTVAPALLAELFDDTALLPPADAPMAAAIQAHEEHLAAWYAGLVGPLVCTEARLPELLAALAGRPPQPEPVAIALVVTGGPDALQAALELAGDAGGVRLAAVDVVLPPRADPTFDAKRAAALLDAVADGTATRVELPRRPGDGGPAGLDVLAGTGHGVRLRTGGCTGPDFPTAMELAGFLLAAAALRVPVSCTGGLRRAVRNRSAATGFEHHGFLNVLLAAVAAAESEGDADLDVLLALLATGDEAELATLAAGLDGAAAAYGRRLLSSIGTGAVTEPVADLERLGLITGARPQILLEQGRTVGRPRMG